MSEHETAVRVETDSDFSPEFSQLMRNRMRTSYHKYGKWSKNRSYVDCLKNVQRRWEEYLKTGNTEFLIDAANFCMMEWLLPSHANAHFRATTSDEAPAIQCKEDGEYGISHLKNEPKKSKGKKR
jgi:hypothetical protein